MNYPYYIVPLVQRYKELSPYSDEARTLALLIAVNIGDKETLMSVLDPINISELQEGFNMEHPVHVVDTKTQGSSKEMPSSPVSFDEEKDTNDSSMDTIDSFLDKFGRNLPSTGYLAQAPLGDPLSRDPVRLDNEAKVSANSNKISSHAEISEFKNLILKQRYKEALELIERQNLNNPQKSIYFAHQMRFIKKLIAIENYKNQTNG